MKKKAISRKNSIDTDPKPTSALFNFFSNDCKLASTIEIRNYLKNNGFMINDPHWSSCFDNLMKFEFLDESSFYHIFKHRMIDLSRIVDKCLIIPEFTEFCDEITQIFNECKNLEDDKYGSVASYIPQLSKVDPELFGMGMCTIDGQRFHIGDSSVDFCLQGCANPITYAVALETLGEDYVHKFVDKEPSGESFNSLSLNKKNIPYNPMINGGAIVICSLIDENLKPAQKFENMLTWLKRTAGGQKCGFYNSVYISERLTADLNYSMAHLMKSKQNLKEEANIQQILDFYFQCCSISTDCQTLSIIASTLAAGGICPLTRERVFSTSTIKSVLSMMYSCGMNDYSGQFAFSVGFPAKSGVSGAMIVVIPGVCGFALYSPRLDKYGNSIRGQAFCKNLIQKFGLHNFDIFNNSKLNPVKKSSKNRQSLTSFLWACKQNDYWTVRNLLLTGYDVNQSDFDKRTGLHIAASEGHLELVELLLQNGAKCSIRDRHYNTPLDDAKMNKKFQIVDLIEKHMNKTDI